MLAIGNVYWCAAFSLLPQTKSSRLDLLIFYNLPGWDYQAFTKLPQPLQKSIKISIRHPKQKTPFRKNAMQQQLTRQSQGLNRPTPRLHSGLAKRAHVPRPAPTPAVAFTVATSRASSRIMAAAEPAQASKEAAPSAASAPATAPQPKVREMKSDQKSISVTCPVIASEICATSILVVACACSGAEQPCSHALLRRSGTLW